jgi:hypothetical protein
MDTLAFLCFLHQPFQPESRIMTITPSRLLIALLLSAATLGAATVSAHGTAPARHGGIVQSANDLSFELVSTPDGAVLYVDDHDKAYDAAKMSGKLTVLQGSNKSEVFLTPAGGNKLEAKGVKLDKGAKAVAVVTSGSKTTTVRFTLK